MQEIVIAVLILVLIVLFYIYYKKSSSSSTSTSKFTTSGTESFGSLSDTMSRSKSHRNIVKKNPNHIQRKLTVEENFMNDQTEWSTGMQGNRVENFSVEQMNSPTMYHNTTTDTDYDEAVQATIDPKMRENHKQWVDNTSSKIFSAVPRKIDDLEIGNYVSWLLRPPRPIPLSEERLLITELGPEDFAENNARCFL